MVSELLKGLRIAFVTSNEGVEQSELTVPWEAVNDAGAIPELLAPEMGHVQAFKHLDKADKFPVHRALKDVDYLDYDALVIPGGVANADFLRTIPAAVTFIHRMFERAKPAGVICHGPWVLIEGDLVRGRTLTSWPSLKTDIRNAGGNWVDSKVQVCTNGPNALVTSRKPGDLPAFCSQFIDVFRRLAQPA
jgi:protease I